MKRLLCCLLLLLVVLLCGCGKVENTVTAKEQTINMHTVSNARQLGGYKTQDGKTVREDVLLRTAALTDMTRLQSSICVLPMSWRKSRNRS